MTTQSWSTRIRHDSDATFREWGSELNTKMAAAGLVQTSDTGQINWSTVTRAGTNSNAGYEIWRFDDSVQSTAPIFIRIDYGTGSNASGPRTQFSVGTGTDGAGTLTGTALATAVSTSTSNVAQTSDAVRNSYCCHTDGFFGLVWKVGASTNTESMFLVSRTVDSSGDPDGAGALIVWSNASSSAAQSLSFASAAAYTRRNTSQTMQILNWPMTPSASLVGSDFQAAVAWTITPRVQPVMGFCGVVVSEFSVGNTFSCTLVGSTAHTYLAGSDSISVEASGTLKVAILWE